MYISRRALKHFVERRSVEMKKHNKNEVIDKLFFAIEHIEEVVQMYDSVSCKNEKYIYNKGYGTEIKSIIRIISEKINTHQEIKSIHFKKNKKAT